MKNVILIFAILGLFSLARAEDTMSDKAKETAHDVGRATKKGAHRAEEGVACAQGDMKCAKTKAENRTKEGSDYMKDKVDEHTEKK